MNGWKETPREPTPEMLSHFRGLNRLRDTEAFAKYVWQTMHDKAPASAMSAGTAETPQEAQGEARQRDPKGDAQPYPPSFSTPITDHGKD